MGRCGKNSVVLAVSLIAAFPAAAQIAQPRSEYEELTQRPKPQPEVPRDLAGVIRGASPERLLVSRLDGGTIEVDISWYEPRDLLMLAGDRYLGFTYTGYEALASHWWTVP